MNRKITNTGYEAGQVADAVDVTGFRYRQRIESAAIQLSAAFLALDEVYRGAALRARFGEDERTGVEIQRRKLIAALEGRSGIFPVQPPGEKRRCWQTLRYSCHVSVAQLFQPVRRRPSG